VLLFALLAIAAAPRLQPIAPQFATVHVDSPLIALEAVGGTAPLAVWSGACGPWTLICCLLLEPPPPL
jgi:hypothetical protein